MNEGEELMLEPVLRLIEGDQLMARTHKNFFRFMDTLEDRQLLEEMVEQGRMPWRVCDAAKHGSRLSISAL
jgi:glucose-1-phosphate cytidylyltransferase